MPSIKINCPCGNQFIMNSPTVENMCIVICPLCGAKLRLNPVNLSVNQYKKNKAPSEADGVATQIRGYEFALGIAWLIFGIIQLVFFPISQVLGIYTGQ